MLKTIDFSKFDLNFTLLMLKIKEDKLT